MSFFKKFASNTYAGCANQYHFKNEGGENHTSRVYFKITAGGEYNYSLLFSNIVDGSYRGVGVPNVILDDLRSAVPELANAHPSPRLHFPTLISKRMQR